MAAVAAVSVIVRATRPDDREPIAAVIGSDATFRDDEIAVALELVDAGLDGSTDYRLLVAEIDGAVAGYICFGPTPMTKSTYDLYWIVVAASARGRGAAGALVRAMEAAIRATGGGQVRVETSETEGYGAARALYARLEYPIAVELADFYAPGDGLITYFKRI